MYSQLSADDRGQRPTKTGGLGLATQIVGGRTRQPDFLGRLFALPHLTHLSAPKATVTRPRNSPAVGVFFYPRACSA